MSSMVGVVHVVAVQLAVVVVAVQLALVVVVK